MEYIKLSKITTVITLGGKGTRLREITQDIPKPLWPILGMHTLERSIKVLHEQGLRSFIFIINYKSDSFFKEALILEKKYEINIEIFEETHPLGEAGSLLDMVNLLNQNFLFISGDIIFDIDIKRFLEFHLFNNSDLTFITHLTNHPEDSDCISETPTLSINKYKLKSQIGVNEFYLGNAGIALLNKKVLTFIKQKYDYKNKNLSLFKDFIIEAHNNNFHVFSYNTSEYIKDMGTTKRLNLVEVDIKNNIVKNNSYRNVQKALFVDRDNTLIKCEKKEYITSQDQIYLYENRISKIAEIASSYNLVILVTNQPQIAMGKVSYQEVININTKLILSCQKRGLNIACVYICPHHNHSGFLNEDKSLKTFCFCRKPMPGLFLEASIHRNISLNESLLIGDSWRDEESSKKLNMNFKYVQYLK